MKRFGLPLLAVTLAALSACASVPTTQVPARAAAVAPDQVQVSTADGSVITTTRAELDKAAAKPKRGFFAKLFGATLPAAQDPVNCATTTPCTTSGPSATGTGDQSWLAMGKLNQNDTTLFDMFGTGSHLATDGSASSGDIASLFTGCTGGNILLGSDGTCHTSSGTGSVTSVGVTTPPFLVVSGSPVTTNGTIAIASNSEPANQVVASPNGSAGDMTSRALVGADIPAISLAASGNGGVSGNLPMAQLSSPASTQYEAAVGNTSGSAPNFENQVLFAPIGAVTQTSVQQAMNAAGASGAAGAAVWLPPGPQYQLTLTASPSGTSGTLTAPFPGLTGVTYFVQFSDGTWQPGTHLANAQTTISWPTAVTDSPSTSVTVTYGYPIAGVMTPVNGVELRGVPPQYAQNFAGFGWTPSGTVLACPTGTGCNYDVLDWNATALGSPPAAPAFGQQMLSGFRLTDITLVGFVNGWDFGNLYNPGCRNCRFTNVASILMSGYGGWNENSINNQFDNVVPQADAGGGIAFGCSGLAVFSCGNSTFYNPSVEAGYGFNGVNNTTRGYYFFSRGVSGNQGSGFNDVTVYHPQGILSGRPLQNATATPTSTSSCNITLSTALPLINDSPVYVGTTVDGFVASPTTAYFVVSGGGTTTIQLANYQGGACITPTATTAFTLNSPGFANIDAIAYPAGTSHSTITGLHIWDIDTEINGSDSGAAQLEFNQIRDSTFYYSYGGPGKIATVIARNSLNDVVHPAVLGGNFNLDEDQSDQVWIDGPRTQIGAGAGQFGRAGIGCAPFASGLSDARIAPSTIGCYLNGSLSFGVNKNLSNSLEIKSGIDFPTVTLSNGGTVNPINGVNQAYTDASSGMLTMSVIPANGDGGMVNLSNWASGAITLSAGAGQTINGGSSVQIPGDSLSTIQCSYTGSLYGCMVTSTSAGGSGVTSLTAATGITLNSSTGAVTIGANQCTEPSAITASTYTVQTTDVGCILPFNNASGVAVSLPQATGSFGAGANVGIQNNSTTGLVTVTTTTSTFLGIPSSSTLTVPPLSTCWPNSNNSNWQVTDCTGNTGPNVQVFTGSGSKTWTAPTLVNGHVPVDAEIVALGCAGGAGSSGTEPSGTAMSGGAGGGGADRKDVHVSAAALGASLSWTMCTPGAGGAAVTSAGNGNAGAAGTNLSIDGFTVFGGGGGAGGQNGTTTGGGGSAGACAAGGTGSTTAGSAGACGGLAGGTSSPGSPTNALSPTGGAGGGNGVAGFAGTNPGFGAPGGSGGAGLATSPTSLGGGNAPAALAYGQSTNVGGTAGNPGNNGSAPSSQFAYCYPGQAGSGAGSSSTGAGPIGGNGAQGAGGGGGGAGLTTNGGGGAGGTGGGPCVAIITTDINAPLVIVEHNGISAANDEASEFRVAA